MKTGKIDRSHAYKRKFTRFVMQSAYQFPIFFPKWLVHESRERMKNGGIWDKSFFDEQFKYISFFDSDFRWHKCSISFLLTKKELDLIAKWRVNFSLSGFDFDRYKDLNDVSFVFGASWNNLGIIRINAEHFFDDLNSLYLDTKYVDYLSVHLEKFGSGLFMMRYDIVLNKTATDFIKNVEIEDPDFDAELRTYNIFSKRDFGYTVVDRHRAASEKLFERINFIFQDVFLVWKSLNDLIGINIEVASCSAISEVCIMNGSSYKQADDVLYEIKKDYPHYRAYKEKDSSLIYPYSKENYPFDAIYFYNEKESSDCRKYPEFWPPSARDGIIRSFSFINIVSNEIGKLAREISRVNYDGKGSVLAKESKYYFQLSYKAEVFLRFLNVFKKSSRLTPSKEMNSKIKNLIDYNIDQMKDIKDNASTLYELSESKLQMDNLKYHKRYSAVVFLFILMQVILAAMAIDWLKIKGWISNF
ncbi:hypothetical protein [Pectobacterium brasiliense]|uniref:hypothetical protein n=1 Tax=Pectobacterium brasiliense TaxID=180957 RepID=UPI00300E5923